MSVPLIISHRNCFDGFTAAWVAKRYANLNGVEPEIYFANYAEDPPDVTGRDVLMFDFSYKRPVLLEMNAKAKSMVVIDHHKSAKEDLEGLDFCQFDMSRSGAQLAWDWLFGIERPQLVDYVADRDLWLFKLSNSKEINAAIASYPKTFEVWDNIHNCFESLTGKDQLISEGSAILRYQNQCIDEMAQTAVKIKLPKQFGKFAGTPIMAANAPYLFASILGNKLAEISPSKIGCAWFRRKDGQYQYSFRSIGDVDVALIAQQIGGGGHRNASGAESDVLLV